MTKLTLTPGGKKPSEDSEKEVTPIGTDFDQEVGVLVKVMWAGLCSAQASGAVITRNGVAVAFADVMLKLTAAQAKSTGQQDKLREYLEL